MILNRLIYIGCLIFSLLAHSNGSLPDKLIFAVQPHDALRYANDQLNDNVVVKLSNALNIPIEIYECPWVRCMQAIKSGEADIIDDLFYSQQRSTFLHFLQPSFNMQLAGFRFYADNSQTPVITRWEDLANLRIGMLRGYEHFPEFNEASHLQKLDFLSIDTVSKMILKGRIDTFIAPPSFNEKNFENIDVDRRITQQPLLNKQPMPLFLGLSKSSNWFEHRKILEETLQQVIGKPVS